MNDITIGTIKKGYEIGYKSGSGKNKYAWTACPICNKPRWVQLLGGKPRRNMCYTCRNKKYVETHRREKNVNWKGGRRENRWGYILVKIEPSNPFYSMVQKHGDYVLEHRLVMAQNLNRCLLYSEKVHHINGIKTDNRIVNLEILNESTHQLKEQFCQNCILRKEIRLLRWQISELLKQSQGKLI